MVLKKVVPQFTQYLNVGNVEKTRKHFEDNMLFAGLYSQSYSMKFSTHKIQMFTSKQL